jgi:hypothetical protein
MALRKTRIDPCDTLFSKLTKERAEWTCEKCGKVGDPDVPQGMHCSHRQSRKHYSTRFAPDNSDCLCFSCHRNWWHASPLEGWNWLAVDRGLGQDFIDDLRARSRVPFRGYKQKKPEIKARLEAELARLQDLRAQGVTGRIEFDSPYEGLI